ncbi:MAG: hypothetical protein J3K34DRAFT_415480 [Monoraphidium minutum]|nr:MAG: hypothetical protein J3K34DRAFT_415480 [Monoraphidium minutum]
MRPECAPPARRARARRACARITQVCAAREPLAPGGGPRLDSAAQPARRPGGRSPARGACSLWWPRPRTRPRARGRLHLITAGDQPPYVSSSLGMALCPTRKSARVRARADGLCPVGAAEECAAGNGGARPPAPTRHAASPTHPPTPSPTKSRRL